MTHEELREAVLKATEQVIDDVPLVLTDPVTLRRLRSEKVADAALAAIRDAGFAIVPAVPSEKMDIAGTNAWLQHAGGRLSWAVWTAMLKAAQEGKP